MSTHDLKFQQSSCQSGQKASVTCVVSDRERFYPHTDKSRFQNVSEQEKSHPVPSAQHIHNKEDLETRTTASSPSLQLSQQKSFSDLQIKQIILIRSRKNSNRTPEEQKETSRFTSTISITLPSRNKKDTAEEKTLHTTTNFNSTLEGVKNTANQHHTELKDVSPTEQCGQSIGELFKDGNGQKATFNKGALHQHGHITPKQGQNTGIQHNIDLHEQIVHEDSHSTQLVYEVQIDITNESGVTDCRDNASTTPQYQKNLDSGLKASSEVLNQVLSLASFSAPPSEETPEPEPNLFNPTSTMLTSALASVLVPPWSGRLRRSKQGGSEVEHETQDYGQNGNPSTLLRQDRQQQPFFPFQRQPSEHTLANDNDIQVTAGTSYSPDWQKENNSPNVTTTIQPKRPIMKFSSVDTLNSNTELHSFPTHLDTRQVPESPHSEYRMSETQDQHKPFKSLSSKPTTSSLLLSLRRSNLRSASAEPTQTPITRSVRALTLPSRIVLKTPSFAQSVTPDDQITEYPDTPTKTEGIPVSQFPFSPRTKNRVPLRTPLLLNKPETDISKKLETSVPRAEDERFPHPTTRVIQRGILKSQQRSYSVILREYFSTEDIDPVEQNTGNNTNLQNSNIKQQTLPDATHSPKDSTNFNIQQSGFNIQNLNSQSTQNLTASSSLGTSTFTDRLNFSPRKDSTPDGMSPKNVGQIYLDSKKHSYSSQSSMDLSSPISPSRPIRSVKVPSIYSYLRQSSPAVSTPSPSTPSPHINRVETTPPKQDGGVTLHGDRKSLPSRFSFDFNPFVPQVQELQRCSYGSSTHIAPAQSLPPDFGRGSAPRLSTSPYSSLISSRPALSNTLQERSSPPASKTHTRSTSYDIVTTHADFVKGDPNSSPSTYASLTRRPREHFAYSDREQRTTVQAYTSALDIHRPAQPCLSQTAPDFVMESRSANISPHPRRPHTGSDNFPHQEHDGLMALQLDKGNANPNHRLSEKEKYLLSKKLKAESETPLRTEKDITVVHMHERLQETQSPSSKKGLFASRVKKDSGFSTASLPDKDVVSPQYLKTKRHSPVFKTSSRIDQMLTRIKMTFGVKRSDSTLDTVTKKNKTPTQQPSNTETFEKPKTEEKTFGSQRELSLIADKASLDSPSPPTLRISDTLKMEGQNRSKAEVKYSGCTWEVPNSSLTNDKASFRSPLTLKKPEDTLNMDWEKRSKTMSNKQNGSRCSLEASNSSLTTDKPSFRSFSPLTLKKPEDTLNMDWEKRSTTMSNKQNASGSMWEASNSFLTTDKPSFRSFSPLTLKKPEDTLNMDWEKRSTTMNNKQNGSRCSLETSNSSLTTDKPSFGSFSPLTLKKPEDTLNMDWEKRSTTMDNKQNGSRCSLEASNSSLTTDKPSFGSFSPLTLKKPEDTLNMDWEKRSTTMNNKQNGSRCSLEASNSSLTTDKPSFGSFSPLTLKKPEDTLNMDWEKGSTTTNNKQNGSGSMWEASNSFLATDKAYLSSFRSLSPIALKNSSENELIVEQNKRHSDENGNRYNPRSFSPHRVKAQSMIRSATLPHYRKSSVGPPSPFYLFDFDSEDIQNDNVFYSPVSKKTNSLCESDDFSPLSSSKFAVQQPLLRSRLYSSCADLKYGLQNGRSFSVSSVVSSRPSGPGRISTSSISDLSSLDDFVPKGNYTVVDSSLSSSHSPSYDPKSVSGKQSQPGYTDELEHDFADPTPPPSPTLSPSPRRISQAPAMSSPMRTTPENLSSSRSILPSRSYADFEESDSDTTTDDEYYLGNGSGDEVETEL